MAVGAYWPQVLNGVQFILSAAECKRLQVVNVYKVLPDLTVAFRKK
jgi:hypothetical protein